MARNQSALDSEPQRHYLLTLTTTIPLSCLCFPLLLVPRLDAFASRLFSLVHTPQRPWHTLNRPQTHHLLPLAIKELTSLVYTHNHGPRPHIDIRHSLNYPRTLAATRCCLSPIPPERCSSPSSPASTLLFVTHLRTDRVSLSRTATLYLHHPRRLPTSRRRTRTLLCSILCSRSRTQRISIQ